MADAPDSKSGEVTLVWVRLPPLVLFFAGLRKILAPNTATLGSKSSAAGSLHRRFIILQR